MKKFTTLTSKAIYLGVDDIDTDQIIPARYLKTTDKEGLGAALFANWRYEKDGSETASFALNQPENQSRSILLAGDNFGCGSSREHAPWALAAWGFRVIVSTSFADIFRNNALKNGILLISVAPETHDLLVRSHQDGAESTWTVDLEAQSLAGATDTAVDFTIDPFSKRCLLEGLDQLQYILSFENEINAFEAERGS